MQKVFVQVEDRPDVKALYYLDKPNVLFVNIYGELDGVVQIIPSNTTEETQGKEMVQA